MSSTAVTGRVREDCRTSKAISLHSIIVPAYKAFFWALMLVVRNHSAFFSATFCMQNT